MRAQAACTAERARLVLRAERVIERDAEPADIELHNGDHEGEHKEKPGDGGDVIAAGFERLPNDDEELLDGERHERHERGWEDADDARGRAARRERDRHEVDQRGERIGKKLGDICVGNKQQREKPQGCEREGDAEEGEREKRALLQLLTCVLEI